MTSIKAKAIVSVCAAALPFSAVMAEDNTFEIYGSVEARTIDRDQTDLDTFVSTARLGFKGDQSLPNSDTMDLRWQLEFDLPKNGLATDGADGGDVHLRKGSISLQGGFGEVILGRQNNLLASTKKIDTFKNDSGTYLMAPDRLGNAISYVSPSFGGANIYIQMASDADAASSDGVGEDNDVDARVFGIDYNGDNFYIGYGHYEVEDTYPSGAADISSLGFSVSFGQFSLFGTHQDNSTSDRQATGLGVSMASGDWTYKLGNLSFEQGSSDGSATYALANYSFGNSVSAFLQYVDYDSAAEGAGKGDAISVGIATSVSKLFTY